MHDSVRLGLLALMTAGALAAQAPHRLRFEVDEPAVQDLLARCANTLCATGAADDDALPAQDRGDLLLAHLWLGLPERAAGYLRAVPAGDDDDDAWHLVQQYWYLRATDDDTEIRRAADRLAADARRVAHRFRTAASTRLETATLRVHALSCAVELMTRLGRRDAARHADARAALAALESRFWRADLQRFSPRALDRGDDDAPSTGPATQACLVPCRIGMLSTTGDKTMVNLATALAEWRPGGDVGVDAAAALRSDATVVIGHTQLGSDPMPLLLDLATRSRADDVPLDRAAAAALLDATLFASTGLRQATGPGVDTDWLRLRPRLPPGARRLAVRGLRRDGWAVELWLERRVGPPDAGELDCARACGLDPGAGYSAQPRWLGAVRIRKEPGDEEPGDKEPEDKEHGHEEHGHEEHGHEEHGHEEHGDTGAARDARTVVVICGARQFVTQLTSDRAFAFVAPAPISAGRAPRDSDRDSAPRRLAPGPGPASPRAPAELPAARDPRR